jgi:hypothetical protein
LRLVLYKEYVVPRHAQALLDVHREPVVKPFQRVE